MKLQLGIGKRTSFRVRARNTSLAPFFNSKHIVIHYFHYQYSCMQCNRVTACLCTLFPVNLSRVRACREDAAFLGLDPAHRRQLPRVLPHPCQPHARWEAYVTPVLLRLLPPCLTVVTSLLPAPDAEVLAFLLPALAAIVPPSLLLATGLATISSLQWHQGLLEAPHHPADGGAAALRAHVLELLATLSPGLIRSHPGRHNDAQAG
jgi:hypothetical protein